MSAKLAIGASADGTDDVERAARGMEALLLRQLLSEVRKASGGAGLLDGAGTETFREMLDEALCDKATEGKGIGLRQVFTDQLDAAASAKSRTVSPASGTSGRIEQELLKALPTRPNQVGGGHDAR